MGDFVFSNCDTRCDNSSCKFIKGHAYPCSNTIGYEAVRCNNNPCCKSNGHNGDCLFYKSDRENMSQSMIPQYQVPNMFNMQYQQLINDHQRYSNFNNNNDQRKFVINYVTINNYYGNSSNGSTGNNASQYIPKLEEIVNTSNFIPQFSNPSNHLIPYRR